MLQYINIWIPLCKSMTIPFLRQFQNLTSKISKGPLWFSNYCPCYLWCMLYFDKSIHYYWAPWPFVMDSITPDNYRVLLPHWDAPPGFKDWPEGILINLHWCIYSVFTVNDLNMAWTLNSAITILPWIAWFRYSDEREQQQKVQLRIL